MFLQHEPSSAARAISAFMEQSEFGSSNVHAYTVTHKQALIPAVGPCEQAKQQFINGLLLAGSVIVTNQHEL